MIMRKLKFSWQLPALVLVLALLFLAATGCGAQNPGGSGKASGKKEISSYTVADPTGDWGFPSPYAHYSRGPGYVRMSFIFDTLIWKDDKGYVPALAEKWEYNKEENAYVFKLQENVTWHDGEKFTAKDVVFTVNYTKEHPYQWVDTTIIKNIEAVNDYQVKIYLKEPYAPFLEYVGGALPILPEHIWKEIKSPEQFQQKEASIGTGPFMLGDYNKEHGTYLYNAYDKYYQGTPKVKQLKFVKINEEIAAAALRQKQVNASAVPAELVKDLEKDGFKSLIVPHEWTAKLLINHNKEPLNSKQFRQALAYAVDRKALVETVLRGEGVVASPGLLPDESSWYNPGLNQYEYSPEKAMEIIQSLGYHRNGNYWNKDGRDLELELMVPAGGIGARGVPGERDAEMIKQQLEKAGIKVKLRGVERKTLDNLISEWKFDLALSGHGGLGGDPEILKKVILAKGFTSARYEKSEKMNELMKKQLQQMDLEKRKDLVNQIQEVYAEEMPALPLYYPTWYWIHDGQADLYNTKQGLGSGVPIPLNKMSFVK